MRIAHCITFGLILGLILTWSAPAAARPLRATNDLDGNYVGIGLIINAVRMEGGWDGGFGGEISLTRVRENQPLSALGIAAGAMHFAKRDNNGRLWADLSLANRTLMGFTWGLSGGLSVEIDDLAPPRWGGHGTLWIFAGVIPYVRIGAVENTGIFMDFGVRVALPAFRW